MKSLIDQMGLGQYLAMILVLCLIVLGVCDCSSGKTKTFSCEIVDREIRRNYDNEHHTVETSYYLYAQTVDGVHCVNVTRTQYYTLRLGEIRILKARYGKLTNIIYLQVIL